MIAVIILSIFVIGIGFSVFHLYCDAQAQVEADERVIMNEERREKCRLLGQKWYPHVYENGHVGTPAI